MYDKCAKSMVMVVATPMRMLRVVVIEACTLRKTNIANLSETIDLGIRHLSSEFCLNIRKPHEEVDFQFQPDF